MNTAAKWFISNALLYFNLWEQKDKREEYGFAAFNLVATRAHLRCMSRQFLDERLDGENFLKKYREAGPDGLVAEALNNIEPLRASQIRPVERDIFDHFEAPNIARRHMENCLVLSEAAEFHPEIAPDERRFLKKQCLEFCGWAERHTNEIKEGIKWIETILNFYCPPEMMPGEHSYFIRRMKRWSSTVIGA